MGGKGGGGGCLIDARRGNRREVVTLAVPADVAHWVQVHQLKPCLLHLRRLPAAEGGFVGGLGRSWGLQELCGCGHALFSAQPCTKARIGIFRVYILGFRVYGCGCTLSSVPSPAQRQESKSLGFGVYILGFTGADADAATLSSVPNPAQGQESKSLRFIFRN
jgi:hypothetical protein